MIEFVIRQKNYLTITQIRSTDTCLQHLLLLITQFTHLLAELAVTLF